MSSKPLAIARRGIEGPSATLPGALTENSLSARIRSLSAQGLRPRDISSVLCIHPQIVLREIERGEPVANRFGNRSLTDSVSDTDGDSMTVWIPVGEMHR